jgi:ferrochelatase
MPAERTGLLLINVGTPDTARTADVRRYLRQFLSDPRVLDLPAWRRALVLNLIILPIRPRRSALAYAKIWTAEGSPLRVHGLALRDKLRQRLPGVEVELGLRYGRPSIAQALARLQEAGASRIVVFPLYPQYSSAATGSALACVFAQAARLVNVPSLHVVPPFHDHPAFLEATAALARPYLERVRPERVLFSFHGLPERQVRRSDPTGSHCLTHDDCCRAMVEANRYCYRAQCFATARALTARLGVGTSQNVVCFQSRLGRTPWIRPYTDEVILRLAREGVRRAVILSPAFVADCLETLEELGLRAAADFRAAGGELLQLVPALNADDRWADALVRIARDGSSWLAPSTAWPSEVAR